MGEPGPEPPGECAAAHFIEQLRSFGAQPHRLAGAEAVAGAAGAGALGAIGASLGWAGGAASATLASAGPEATTGGEHTLPFSVVPGGHATSPMHTAPFHVAPAGHSTAPRVVDPHAISAISTACSTRRARSWRAGWRRCRWCCRGVNMGCAW